MKKQMKLREHTGITLIALVITIIVLLILVGISIASLTGENGVLTKASKSEEEYLIEQYKEEINLIIIEEITERKIKEKEELMIVSLDTKIRQKEWVKEIYKCNKEGEEQPTFETSTHLLVKSKENYEFLIEVNEANKTAKIISSQKEIGEKYKLTYDANEGEGEAIIIEIESGSSIILQENTYTKAGYVFIGWCEDRNGNAQKYSAGDRYKVEKDTILYAIWERGIVEITFNSNTGTGTMDSMEIEKDKKTQLIKNTFKKANYKFKEWNTKADGTGTNYKNKSEIAVTNDTTLYAIWTSIYPISKTYLYNEGEIHSEIEDVYKVEYQSSYPQGNFSKLANSLSISKSGYSNLYVVSSEEFDFTGYTKLCYSYTSSELKTVGPTNSNQSNYGSYYRSKLYFGISQDKNANVKYDKCEVLQSPDYMNGTLTGSGSVVIDITGFDFTGYIKFVGDTASYNGQKCNCVIDKIWVE